MEEQGEKKTNLLARKLLNDKLNLRVDKNMAFQILDFKKQGREMEILLKNLVIYMSLNFQKNLFGLVELDPSDFAKTMKLDRSDLFRKAENPIYYELQNKTEEELKDLERLHGNMSEYRCWDNNLENALLILQHINIHSSYKTKLNNSEKITIKNFRYIKSIHIFYRTVGKTKKIIYQYEPTEEFEQSLRKFFLLTNVNKFIALRKSNLEDCYFRLFNQIQDEELNNNDKIKYSFESIAELLDIDLSKSLQKNEFSDKKYRINSRLKKFIEVVGNDIKGLTFRWEKGKNSNYGNVLVFEWEKKNQVELAKHKDVIYLDLLYTELIKELSIYYKTNYEQFTFDDDILMGNFLHWLVSFTNKEDFDFKVSSYIVIYTKLWGNKKDLKYEAEKFFLDLVVYGQICAKLPQDKKIIYYKRGLYHIFDKKTGKEYTSDLLKDFILYLKKWSKYFNEEVKGLYEKT